MVIWKNVLSQISCVVSIFCVVSAMTFLAGCEETGATKHSGAEQNNAQHHNFKFHRPKTLDEAVKRLSAIHEAVDGQGKLPGVRTLEYVEVIHGQGPSAHSHFYLAENYTPDMEHDEAGHDEEEHERVERHTMTINFRNEFSDIARWLPDIAAASDLGSVEWQSVSDTSKTMIQLLESIPADPTDPKLRDAWRQNSEKFAAMIGELQKSLGSTSGDGK